MSIDLTSLSVAELDQLIRDAGARIEVVKRQQYAQLRRSLEVQARDAGFDVYEVFNIDRTKSPKRVAASTQPERSRTDLGWDGKAP